jgi:Flp pilus assembly pilin Flp
VEECQPRSLTMPAVCAKLSPSVVLIFRPTEGWDCNMTQLLRKLWVEEGGQDIAEYAVMLAVILVLVVGTVRLIGSNANTVFSNAASSIQ